MLKQTKAQLEELVTALRNQLTVAKERGDKYAHVAGLGADTISVIHQEVEELRLEIEALKIGNIIMNEMITMLINKLINARIELNKTLPNIIAGESDE